MSSNFLPPPGRPYGGVNSNGVPRPGIVLPPRSSDDVNSNGVPRPGRPRPQRPLLEGADQLVSDDVNSNGLPLPISLWSLLEIGDWDALARYLRRNPL
jgi:hypothetical protein